MSGDDFSGDAAQYAELAGEIYTQSNDPLDQLMGGTLEPEPLDRQELDANIAQQNRAHANAKPVQQEAQEWLQEQNQRLPSAEEDPIGHFGQRMANMEQVTQAFGTMQAGQQFWDQVNHSETQARAEISDYDQGIEALETGRFQELCQMFPDARLRQMGYADPNAARLAMLNQDRIAVATQAIQRGMSPAHLYYEIARMRGYDSQRHISPREAKVVAGYYDRGDGETFDKAWDLLARKGLL